MSKRLDVLSAVKAMIDGAAPGADIVGLEGSEAAARRVSPLGLIVMGAGDLGEPEITLSPLTYFYDHSIPVQVISDSEMLIDELMAAIGRAVDDDRTLGGLCDWLAVTAAGTEGVASTDDRGGLNGRIERGGSFTIVASYATSNPLT